MSSVHVRGGMARSHGPVPVATEERRCLSGHPSREAPPGLGRRVYGYPGNPINAYDLDGRYGWHWKGPWHRDRWSSFRYGWHVRGYARARHYYHRVRNRIHRNQYVRRYYHNPYVQACFFRGGGNGLVAWATKAARRSWYAAGVGCGMGIAARRWQR